MRPAAGGESRKRDSLFLYRKFLKQSEIVYNELEIKNDMTKERMGRFAMTLFMKFFVLV